MQKKLLGKFEELFGAGGDIRTYFAPGRVNLIGEHTDYNGGHVFPCALTIGTYGIARMREDDRLRMYSLNFEETGMIESSIVDIKNVPEDNWANYLKGVIWTFQEKKHKIPKGMDILLYGTIPNGSGLSSSASIEVLMGVILKDMFDCDVTAVDIALLGQYSENNFNGVNCGIMDQFAVAMGKENHAIFLNTSNLNYKYAPVSLEKAKIVIANTNKKRGLGDSKYNERRAECEEALADLQKVLSIRTLGELTNESFEQAKEVICRPVCVKRARHAVSENQRTIQAVEALKNGDIEGFGQLMNQSHISLRDDYEVTGAELDTLVEAAWEQEGVIGARMTGAGFGGCAVSIVRDEGDCLERFVKNVGKIYKEKIGYDADFYIVEIGNGASRI